MIGGLLPALWVFAAGGPSCQTLENEVWTRLTTSEAAMDAESARGMLYEEATGDAQQCPQSERIAYVRLRVLELGAGDAQLEAQRVELGRKLVRSFPRSARIATVVARLERSAPLARQAVGLDPAYAPAGVALAALLFGSGDTTGAQAAISATPDIAAVENGFAVLARIRWASGDVDGTIEAAQRQLAGRKMPIEPGGGVRQAADDEAHELLGVAYLKKARPDRAAPHLIAASEAGSARARQIVRSADPALRRALARARKAR
jgi:hypothetical protein